ncbi:TonB-dependent receptor [Flavihumibacter rivuli]|uniref:SusC/RagA family TonB-linked outer membrane protein n=1 Tax=Flavihumibacter rivuli TaxID=2838156 RepID=UPI001BDE99A2|nr:TonB-dependent receptor [Flavihumibacter rivuli]ULQ55105.1 TonB-dependent receptor [Flavihumibacter rivuli]
MRKLLIMTACMIALGGQLFAQTRTIKGRVTDATGKPVANASVMVKGTKNGTTTAEDGSYTITIPENAKDLVVSAVGYGELEQRIGNGDAINISLTTQDKNLQEVVVVGYQSSKRRDLTGSVATVSAKEFEQVPIASFTQILQGKAPGVNIVGVNGRPGAAAYIRIRGVGSISAGSEPLIIIDGVPANSNILNAINPNDIENVSVLKDAASASIYGSRGSNGVMVVTTKRGKGKPQLTYRFQYGVKERTGDINMGLMSAEEKLQYEYDFGYENSYVTQAIATLAQNGQVPAGSAIFDLNDAQRQAVWSEVLKGKTNWEDYLFQRAPLRSHEISLNGSDRKFKYYMSLSSYDEDGVAITSNFKRTGGRLNVEYEATDWFKIGNNLSVYHTRDQLVRERYNAQSPYTAYYLYNPYEPAYLPDGDYNIPVAGFPILEAVKNNPEFTEQITGITNLYGEFTFFKDLKIKSSLALNYNNYKREAYTKPGSFLDQILRLGGSKTDNGFDDFTYVWTNTANYTKSVRDVHNFRILAGTEYNENNFKSYTMTGQGFPTASVSTLDNASTPLRLGTSKSDWSLFSLFGQLGYNFDQKYYVDFSLRRDGSSRFGANNKYGTFWAVGAGWNLSDEAFLKNASWINLLKLRGSVGTSGNYNIGNYASLALFAVNVSYNNQPAAVPSAAGNSNLTWEKNFNYDLGVDFEFFNNRLRGSVEAYHRTTSDLLLNVPISQGTGFGTILQNKGEMVNKGIEAALQYDILRTKDLTWNVFANFTYNQNRITELYGGSEFIPTTLSRYQIGEPINVFFLNRWAGVDPQTGEQQFLDKDGKPTTAFSGGDAVVLSGKAPDPRWFGSFGTAVNYKGFELNAQFYYSGGNYVMNYNYQATASDGENIFYPQLKEALNYWKQPGDIVKYPSPNSATAYQTFDTDKYLQKGDYLRLRNLTLAYNLPSNILNRIKMQRLRFYVQGQNLFTVTNFYGDPEVGLANGESFNVRPGLATLFGYPQTKALTFGVDVTF